MKLLVIDGNSIINRAFYGIKMLTTKEGVFTNGIYGFLSILIKLREECNPDSIAVAFDLKDPTFRHKMYSEYKAGRKGMPPELASQMPILKELLPYLGISIIEKPGYEADDILGTLSAACGEGDECFIATGDRDSFQLIRDNVTVLLASTKMGKAQTVHCTPDYIRETYGVEPLQMIEIKALQGDSSDNIPGVAGVGEKTASDLIARFGNIEYIYEHLDELDIKSGVHDKLAKDKDNAFLSRTLGTICLEVPIDTNIETYKVTSGNPAAAASLLRSLEMFGMVEKLGLKDVPVSEAGVKDEKPRKKLLVNVCKDFSEVLPKLKEAKKAVFTLKAKGTEIESLCFSVGGEPVLLESSANFDGFLEFLGDRYIKKYVDDSKAIFSFAMANGVSLESVMFDGTLVGYILNPSANAYDPIRLLEEYGKGKISTIDVDTDNEQVKQTVALGLVSPYLLSVIDENNQADLLVLEICLAEVLANMEQIGFLVDAKGLTEYGEIISQKVSELTHKIYDEAGFEFNLNSPKQLGVALFEKLGIPCKKKTKSGYSTSADVLEGLADDYPIVSDILEYRMVAKLKSTYCDGLLKVIAEDGRIHSTLNQTETRTGRISSTEPNLQNIPVRKPLGSELRKFFVAKEGYSLIDADYSQIELRVLAHMADDKNMIEAFKSGEDVHRITAAQVFGVSPKDVTSTMRSNAKAVNFGIVYGIGAFSLAKDIGVSRAEADAYIKGYLSNFSGVDSYMKNVVANAHEDGYVKTLYERRRYLPELSSSNGMLRAFGERVARNMPIQGTAADIIKIAMVKVYNRLKLENLDARLIMQVHDELIVEAKDDIAEKVCEIVKEEMENACALKVKLVSDAHIGKTWYEAKG